MQLFPPQRKRCATKTAPHSENPTERKIKWGWLHLAQDVKLTFSPHNLTSRIREGLGIEDWERELPHHRRTLTVERQIPTSSHYFLSDLIKK